MAEFTTELRTICESINDRTRHVPYDDIDAIIENAREEIFSFDYPIFDEDYRRVIETKILKHYFTREIAFDSYGMFKMKLDTKLNEIMPYYNKLYESELLEFNPLYTVNTTTTRQNSGGDTRNIIEERSEEGRSDGSNTGTVGFISAEHLSSTASGSASENVNNNVTSTYASNLKGDTSKGETTQRKEYDDGGTNNKEMFSDTPQGAITGLEAGEYLTNATIRSETFTNSVDDKSVVTGQTTDNRSESGNKNDTTAGTTTAENSSTSSGDNSTDSTRTDNLTSTMENSRTTESSISDYVTTTRAYTETVAGINGNKSSSMLLNEFRSTFLNIDLKVIKECSDLFMQVYW